jgi:hypothetical protein
MRLVRVAYLRMEDITPTLSTSCHARSSNERKEKRTFVDPDICRFWVYELNLSQMMNCRRSFDVGCPHRIHGQTIILLVKRITLALPHGLLKGSSWKAGNRQVPFCGCMAYVRVSPYHLFQLLISDVLAGSGKTIISYVSME